VASRSSIAFGGHFGDGALEPGYGNRQTLVVTPLAPYIERTSSASPRSRLIELLALSNTDLVMAVAPQVADQVLTQASVVPESRLAADLAAAQSWATCRHDGRYPVGLRAASAAPWALFGCGDPARLDRLDPSACVAVVGSRRATTYGREVARELGRDLAREGVVVVSGLAFGVDACAHRGALETGLTVAVLGCGPDIAYPASHRSLWRQVAERGLVLSELPPGTGAWRWSFPARNRIVAGLCAMTVVVEAAQRSGSLITANLAANLGRDLGAVPGPISSRASAGANDLLAGGARLVRDASDVLEVLAAASGANGGGAGQRG
jgi:DNA processing protein